MPNQSPTFDLKLVIVPPLGFLRVYSFLTGNLDLVSICMSNVPAASVEVIVGVVGVVGVVTDRVPTMK